MEEARKKPGGIKGGGGGGGLGALAAALGAGGGLAGLLPLAMLGSLLNSLLHIPVIFGSTVVPTMIGVVAVNALVVSKLSFFLAAIVGLKMLFQHQEHKPTYKVVVQENKNGKRWGKLPKSETDKHQQQEASQGFSEPYEFYRPPNSDSNNYWQPSSFYNALKRQ